MRYLKEIAKIVTKKKVKKIEIFDEHSLKHKHSKFNEFYNALMDGKLKNDREAANLLYNCTPSDDKYRQLKSRFRKRLLNTLFFLDVNLPDTSNYDRAYYSCNKDWTLVKILQSNNAINTAANLARQILTVALRFKFADVIVNCGRILRTYAALEEDEAAFEEYDQYSKQYQDILNAEIRSEEFYQRVVMNYLKPPSKNSNLSEKIDIYCEALDGLADMYDSPVVIYNKYLVWAYRHEMLYQYKEVIAVCNQAEEYIAANPIYYREYTTAQFYLKKISAYLHLNDAEGGILVADKAAKSIENGSDSWFDFMDYYFLLCMHTRNWQRAHTVYQEVTVHAKFKRVGVVLSERWKIYGVYLNFVLDSLALADEALQAQRKKTFRVSSFLNDSVLYPQNQRTFTVLMVLGQILYLIDKKSFFAASERIERLKGYATRHLKKEEHFRAIQFIRLLQQLPKSNFELDKINNADKYYERLKQAPFSYRGLISELEVLPYEQIWHIMLAMLKK
jgi:hypothetical protein